MKKSINSEAVQTAEVQTAEAVQTEAVKPSMLEVLKNNFGTVDNGDGTTRGKFTRLSEKNFSAKEVWERYKFCLSCACVNVQAAISADTIPEQGKYNNRALKWLIECYQIVTKETGAAGIVIFKKHFRKWIVSGVFARGKVNYATGEHSIVMKSWRSLQRVVEIDMSNILNGVDRMTNIVGNAGTAKVVTDYQQKQADAGKQAESAYPKPEAQPEAQPEA